MHATPTGTIRGRFADDEETLILTIQALRQQVWQLEGSVAEQDIPG
jgi:hypothetical protein